MSEPASMETCRAWLQSMPERFSFGEATALVAFGSLVDPERFDELSDLDVLVIVAEEGKGALQAVLTDAGRACWDELGRELGTLVLTPAQLTEELERGWGAACDAARVGLPLGGQAAWDALTASITFASPEAERRARLSWLERRMEEALAYDEDPRFAAFDTFARDAGDWAAQCLLLLHGLGRLSDRRAQECARRLGTVELAWKEAKETLNRAEWEWRGTGAQECWDAAWVLAGAARESLALEER